jgi:RNA recognition motif-containing protein
MSIYVGNLSYDATTEDLTSVFAEYGSVKRVSFPPIVKPGVCAALHLWKCLLIPKRTPPLKP